ncbi:MAG: hypothetical protein ABH889_00345 [Candidatus Portnoybacteria bacterium]
MEQKNIFIEPNEEIVSVIDRLVQSKSREVSLVVPRGAQIWQSSINLKLLKREADNLNKEVTLIVSDNSEREAAEGIGFLVKKEKDFPVQFAQAGPIKRREEPKATKAIPLSERKLDKDKDNMIDLLVEGMESDRGKIQADSLAGEGGEEDEIIARLIKSGGGPERRMADIVNPEKVKVNFFRKRLLGEKEKERPGEKVKIEQKTEDVVLSRVEPVRTIEGGSGFKWSKFLAFFIILAVIISGIVAYLVLPSTEIIITPKIEERKFDLSLIGTVSISRIDEILNRLPLQEIKVVKSDSQEFVATGEKQLNEKARGMITVYNEYSSSDQALVATTRFESPDGKVFRISKNITVPGAKIEEGQIIASSIDVEVIADQPGSDYNIGPTNFTIPGFAGSPKFASFYGKSKESMSGGSIEKVKVVTADDIKQGEKILIDRLKADVDGSLEEQIPGDLKILEGGLKEEVADISSTIEEGDPADKFNLSVDMVVRALLYKEEDLKDLIDLNLIAQIEDDKRPLSDTQKVKWEDPLIDWNKGEAQLSLEVQEGLAFKIDAEKIKNELVGKKEVDVRKYLASQPEIEKAKVNFWPFWVKKIPKQEKKIKITVE